MEPVDDPEEMVGNTKRNARMETWRAVRYIEVLPAEDHRDVEEAERADDETDGDVGDGSVKRVRETRCLARSWYSESIIMCLLYDMRRRPRPPPRGRPCLTLFSRAPPTRSEKSTSARPFAAAWRRALCRRWSRGASRRALSRWWRRAAGPCASGAGGTPRRTLRRQSSPACRRGTARQRRRR